MTNQRSRSAQNKKKQPKKWLKKILKTILIVSLILLGSGVALFIYYASSTPEITAADLDGAIQTRILDKDGELITELGGDKREVIESSEIPQQLKDAITSIEDRRFYSHIGIDPIRIVGSLVRNITRGTRQGGSTITQQLIKLSVFSTKEVDQTYKRKAQEAILALQIEREFSKEQILTYYLNKVYMSNNIYGFGTASQYYFGKPLSELTIAQTALLAGMPQAPNTYDPYTQPENAKNRRDTVLYVMYQNGKLSEEEMQDAQQVPIEEGLVEHTQDTLDTNNQKLVFDPFITLVLEEVKEKTGQDPFNDGLLIETTVDSKAQQELFNIVNSKDYIDYVDDNLQTAVTVVDVKTGEIRAINGGRNQTNLLAYNRATQLNRSTGSTIKPLIDYGPAIEYLDYSTGQTVNDQPIKYSDGTPLNNWDRGFMGPMTLRRALYLSRNTTALQVFREVGSDNITAFLKKLDITVTNDGKEYLVDSNSINTNVTPIKMAAAYAAFANQGVYSKPFAIKKITTRDGQVYTFESEQNQAMKDSTAYMITDILKDSFTKGLATDIHIPGLPQAGKTGSSNYTQEQKDAMNASYEDIIPDSWMIGYSTDYSVAVWTGYDDPFKEGHGVSFVEQKYAKKIYYHMMKYLVNQSSLSNWEQPASVISATIEAGSQPLSLPGPNTPEDSKLTELFVKGTVPTTQSKSFGSKIEGLTGVNAQYDKAKQELLISWNPYQVPDDKKDKPVITISIGAQSQTISEGNSLLVKGVTGKKITFTTKVQVGKDSSEDQSFEITLETDKPQESSHPNDQGEENKPTHPSQEDDQRNNVHDQEQHSSDH